MRGAVGAASVAAGLATFGAYILVLAALARAPAASVAAVRESSVVIATLWLREPLTLSLLAALALILGGIAIGVGLSLAKLIAGVAKLRVRWHDDTLHLDGSATFLSMPRLAAALEAVPAGASVRIDGVHLRYVDHACLEALETWASRHAEQGGEAVVDWGALRSRLMTAG